MIKQKLAIIALGQPNSGKSNTWYEIFGRTIRTGFKCLTISGKELEIFVKNSSFEECGTEINLKVFVRNSSFEEYGDEVEDFFDESELPDIVFCSVQYVEKGIRTLNWFVEQGYYLHIHWLNPGYVHKREYQDHMEFEKRFGKHGDFLRRSGKEKIRRTDEIKQFLLTWATKSHSSSE